MKGGKRPLGYTIIEVMIVLVITGVMFVIASTLINGKQQNTAFTESANELASQIENTLQEVTNGQYSDIDLNCQSVTPGSVPADITVGPGTNSQGTNTGCVFLGKLLVFNNLNSPNYSIVSLAGGQLDPSATAFMGVVTPPGQLLIDSDPTIIQPLTDNQIIPQNITVQAISVTTSTGVTYNNIYNFGFVENLGTPDGDGSFKSGAQPISLAYSNTNSNTNIGGSLAYAQSATVCIYDGTNGSRQANITIGSANGNQLDVSVKRVNSGSPCS